MQKKFDVDFDCDILHTILDEFDSVIYLKIIDLILHTNIHFSDDDSFLQTNPKKQISISKTDEQIVKLSVEYCIENRIEY